MKIAIDRALAERFKLYADITNQSVTDAIQEALEDWMNTCGEGRIEVLTGCPMPMPGDPLEASRDQPTLRLIN